MSKDSWLIRTDKPSYQILKWVGGGGFGQVFKVKRGRKVVACKQIQSEDAGAALDEYGHMTHLLGGPHIATLHDGLEYNPKTKTLSFFMDYYRGKDLDKQVQMLRAAGARFSGSQIFSIGVQIAEALHFCHSKNVLHQDMKTMNILLKDPWNPLIQPTVPELFVADFGISSHVQNLGTRFTHYRGTPGYEAPEIRGKGPAAFSAKSDIYAFGCILYRLITLEYPTDIDDVNPCDISKDYCDELLAIVSTMLSSSRSDRPTAKEVMMQLAAFIDLPEYSESMNCQLCGKTFTSFDALEKHRRTIGHYRDRGSRLRRNEKNRRMKLPKSDAKRLWEDEESGAHPYRNPNCVRKRCAENAVYMGTAKRLRA